MGKSKEKSKKKNDLVSAPISVYIMLWILSIILIVVANIMPDVTIIDVSKLNLSQIPPDGIIKISDDNTWDSIIANLGYGIFCSTVVAGLVDWGATRRQKENDKKEFAETTLSLKNSIKYLIQVRNIFDQVHKEEVSDKNLIEWVQFICGMCVFEEEPFKSKAQFYVNSLMDGLNVTLMYAENIRYKTALLADNHDVPDDFFNNLDNLINYLTLLEKVEKGQKLAQVLSITIPAFFNYFVALFPEYKSTFFEKWNSQKMIQENGPLIPERQIDYYKKIY